MNTLERLKELSQQATPGPWVVGGSYTVRTMRSSLDWIARVRDRHHSHADSEDAANAKLIATLHNALPDLIAVVKAAKEYVEKDKEYLALINPSMQYDIEKLLGLQQAMDKLRAALAALEVEA